MTRRKPLLLALTGILAFFSVLHAARSIIELEKAKELLEPQTTIVSASRTTADPTPKPARRETSNESRQATEAKPGTLQSLLEQAHKAQEEGNKHDALALYRTCLLEGEASPKFSQSKFLEIYGSLARFTEIDPATKRILENHRQSYQTQWRADPSDSSSFFQWLVLNQALDKTNETLTVFDDHAEAPRRHTFYPPILFDALYRAGRYKEAVDVFGYRGLSHLLEAHLAEAQEQLDKQPRGEALQVIDKTVQGVEALAGAGQQEHALELAERLIEIYPLPEVREQIRKKLEQTGEARLASLVEQEGLLRTDEQDR